MPTMNVMVCQRLVSQLLIRSSLLEISILSINVMVWGPLTKRFGVALEHHHMANYDAEATGRLLFIFIKEVAEKHGVTDLARLNIDLLVQILIKSSNQACDHLCQESGRSKKYL